MSEGVIAQNGNLLSWIAAVGRAGDLPTLVGERAGASWPVGTMIRLDPGRNQIEKVA
jgi:phosphohistidine swiveling domain-containing protein